MPLQESLAENSRGFLVYIKLLLFDIVVRPTFWVRRERYYKDRIITTNICRPILDPNTTGVGLLRHVNYGAGHITTIALALGIEDGIPNVSLQDRVAQASIHWSACR